MGSYASPTFADLDGDGDLDAFVGEYSYYSPGNITFFENTGDASNPSFAAPQTNPFGLTTTGFNDTAPTFADLDGDGDLDALVGNSDGGVEFSRNIGNASTPMFDSPVRDPFGLSTLGVNSFPSFVDIDGDGDIDAFVGDFAGVTNFWRNTGDASNPNFSNLQFNPFGLTSVGSNAAPTFVDIDNDGDLDALVGNGNGDILFFENDPVVANQPPVANDDSVTTDEDTAVAVISVLANDSDADGDSLTVTGFDTTGTVGTVTDNGDGTFSYDPNGQFESLNNGDTATDSFTYTISDGTDSDTATVTVTIDGIIDNTAPVAVDDAVTTDEDTAISVITVLANDSDADGDSLTVTGFDTTGTVGRVTDNGDGTFSYDPNGQFESLNTGDTATDSFTYTITDGTDSDTATVTVTIDGITDNTAPVAVDDAVTTDEDTA